MKQGYNSRLDESLGARNGKKSQSMKARRDESKGMSKASGDNPYGVAQSTDPNFEAPSSWRTSLALDMITQGGWDVTLEYNLDQVRQAVFFNR